MALQNLVLYPAGEKGAFPRLARLLINQGEAREQQSLWGEDGHQKTITIQIVFQAEKAPSERLRVFQQAEVLVLEVSGDRPLWQRLSTCLKEELRYRTFTRHSIVRFLAQTGFQLDYTC
ncbi:hypothetical protein COW36_18700 [bacterium (Candidatus Blackallbacteria) CG17_big_fil_post_rev_8_21_14_2_50_48_46]|uniref:Uncharacterized protein n=1 Tax=bacterium (Candidatus Blackallbacteria) CG17_big_fil_post_rev_8_21_14_2_50_48_46 TaxID=2014261 RepID=A0A2M7G1G9_9BACT|nr:MAG: hypothetical protein COW64_00035 [bacterium (Candidatus Blackallbacteria) CG18_big_fil_WC_8_21_14_2_50_49_26]PIW15443.1 MAG: hypothetical protein COW36_18700 [bacterium (Candidatus Blackallbacteria) CG17_big_fil_post_rev_8_21_14_2_50_48_46]PIW49696.1 MAG: hypothetical protein COW20_04665 [bacterium (Candidatus Blackallbacteria) CG13_big_fil_rev_8_21_14_2_50_49_14]